MHTTAMRDHPPLSTLLDPQFFNQPADSVKCAAHFESANTLEILAFEEQLDHRLRRCVALPLRAPQCSGSLRCGCDVRERGVGLYGRTVDVWLDKGMGCFDRVASQRQGVVEGAHGGRRSGARWRGSGECLIAKIGW
jgi:hypothetical protein